MDTTTYASAVADRVAVAISDAGQTQLGIAEATGIPRTTLMRRLSGVTPFTVSELAAIATALNISPDTLLLPTDSPQRLATA